MGSAYLHDQPPEVPEADDDIGCGDFFDPSIFVLNRHGVFKPDWLRHRQLNPGDEIAQDRLGGEAENHAGDASGCVPLNYFIQQPFYNWTRQAGANVGSVLLYLDYTAPIDRIRDQTVELVGQTEQPGGKLVNVQVTNTSAEAIELRLLVTAASVGDTSNLCAELREKLIGFLQREYPEALPRRRHQIIELADRQLDKPMDLRK